MAILKPTLLLLLALSTQALVLPAKQTNPANGAVVPDAFSSVPTKTAPTTQLPAAHPTSLEPEVQSHNSTKWAQPTAPSTAILEPDPKDKYMIGMPTGTCDYRFQLSGKKDHYFLRGRNWNITSEQLQDAIKKVVYNLPEFGISDVGGADTDGKYRPKKSAPDDLITFKYGERFVPGRPLRNSIQEFDAEWFIPTDPHPSKGQNMRIDLEVEFERMLSTFPKYSDRRRVGITCTKLPDDNDSPWHPFVQAGDLGWQNATGGTSLVDRILNGEPPETLAE